MGATITIILVTYQSEGTICSALESLRPSHASGFLECVVVDNNSVDRTLDLVRDTHAWASIVESGGNLGYGKGCNLGLEFVTTTYVMFMNPDATVLPGAVECLVGFLAQRPEVGMIAPAIIENDELQGAGALPSPISILANASGFRFKAFIQRPIQPGGSPKRTDWICGAMLVTRTNLMHDIGGFDPGFFLYFEETDLCRRILDRGLELWTVGEAVACHTGGVSAAQEGEALHAGCISEHFYQSRYLYYVRHWGRSVAVATEVLELVLLVARWSFKKLRGRDAAGILAQIRRPIMQLPMNVHR